MQFLPTFKVVSFVVPAIAALLCVSEANAQSLTPAQQAAVQSAQSELKRLDTNLKLAQSSAGTGTPTGSRAKLAKLRLNTAAASLPAIKKYLAGLPAGNESVSKLNEALKTAEAAITELDDRISGKTAAPPKETPAAEEPGDAPPAKRMEKEKPKSDTVKMGYQQVDALKGAKFNLRAVEGSSMAVKKLVDDMTKIEDKLTINYRDVGKGINTITEAKRKAGFVVTTLGSLPANGEGVAEVADRLKTVKTELAESEKFLAPLQKELMDLIDLKNYPKIREDIKRLRELTTMFGNPMVLKTDRPRAAQVFKQSGAAKNEMVRIAKAYLRLMQQKTEEGKQIEGSGNYFLKTHEKFMAAAEQEKQGLPALIRKDINEVTSIAAEAVQKKKPLFFSGGIPQVMGFADEKVELLEVLDPEQAKGLKKEVADLKAKVKQQQNSLSELIIKQNPLPNDRFKGADRQKAIDVAIDAWKHQQKDFKVLSSRIPSEAWARDTRWEYSNGTWYFIDRSRLQVRLVVEDESNEERAIIRTVNVIKDHQKGDSMIGVPLFSFKDKILPSQRMMRDKIK